MLMMVGTASRPTRPGMGAVVSHSNFSPGSLNFLIGTHFSLFRLLLVYHLFSRFAICPSFR